LTVLEKTVFAGRLQKAGSMFSQKLGIVVGVIVAASAFVRSASAQQATADCEGWIETTPWPERGVYMSSEATLEELQNGVFVAVDLSRDSRFAANGGEVLLSGPWAFTLQSGTYRVRVAHATYDHASSVPAGNTLANWPAASTHTSAMISPQFSCGDTRPDLTIASPSIWTRGVSATLQPAISSAASSTGVLRFSLVSAPSSLAIDQWTGEITCIPSASDVGRRSVIVGLESDGAILDVEAFEVSVVEP
jgi:hypothetical protein